MVRYQIKFYASLQGQYSGKYFHFDLSDLYRAAVLLAQFEAKGNTFNAVYFTDLVLKQQTRIEPFSINLYASIGAQYLRGSWSLDRLKKYPFWNEFKTPDKYKNYSNGVKESPQLRKIPYELYERLIKEQRERESIGSVFRNTNPII